MLIIASPKFPRKGKTGENRKVYKSIAHNHKIYICITLAKQEEICYNYLVK